MARNVYSNQRLEENSAMRSKEACKLFIKMTGPFIEENQVWEMFQEFGRVTEVYVNEKKWAFVTYEDKRDAQNAMAILNRRNVPVHVTYAHDGQKKNNRRSENDFLVTPNTRNFGRGHILNNPYYDGRHRPGMFEEAVFQDELDDPLYTNIQCTIDERGKRVSKGMGYDASDRRSLGGRVPFRNDSDIPAHGYQYRSDLDLQAVSQDDLCRLCDRTALKECGVCAMPYCSRKCQLEDFNRHKGECTIPPLVDRKNTAHLEESFKEDTLANKQQKARNKDTPNKFSEKENKRNVDKEIHLTKNGSQARSSYSNENSTSRNYKSKPEVQQDQVRSPRDSSKRNNSERQRSQNEDGARNDRGKGTQSAPVSKHQERKVENSMAETTDLQVTKESAATTEVARESAATVEVNEQRKLPANKFTEVIITVPEAADTYWVQSAEVLQTLVDVYGAVSAAGADAKESCDPKLGEVYVAPFQGDWYRAKVVSLQPELRVLFIDYGNEETCSPADIKKLPESCKSIPPLAFKIKLIPGTLEKYCNLTADQQLKVMPVESVNEMGAIVVRVEDDKTQSESIKELYAIQNLKEGEQGVGKIIKPVNEEDTLVIMLTESLKKDFLKAKKLDDLVSHLPDENVNPKVGDLVAAEAQEEGLLDGHWGRASILAIIHDRYLVSFIDDCIVLSTKNIKQLPREIADIPQFGAKLTILEYKKPVNGNWTQFFKTDGKFPFLVEEVVNKSATVAIKKGEEKVCRAILSCWNPTSDANSVLLKDGTEVIIAFFDLEYLYVRPVSAIYAQMFTDIEEDLCRHCETVSNLSSIPAVKTLVACEYAKEYSRAQVTEVFKDIIKVYFVDYGNEDTVKLENLKPLSDELQLYPFMAEKIPMKYLTEKDLPAEGTNLLLELSEGKRKLKLKLSNEVPSEIELVMEDGITLNKKLKSFFTPKEKREFVHAPKKETVATKHKSESSPAAAAPKSASSTPTVDPKTSVSSASADQIYRIDEHLEYEGLPVGNTVELLVLHKFSDTDFTCCRRDSPALAHCIGALQEEIYAHCSTCQEQYRPKEIGELCLAKFEDDGQWYRAVYIEDADTLAPNVKIVFIDFGNCADVEVSQIRRMVPEFLKTPAVAHVCTLKDSERMSEAEKAAVGNLVEISSTYEAKILEKNKSSSYVIEMLHVTKAVNSQN